MNAEKQKQRKIGRMHGKFGVSRDHKCGECENLVGCDRGSKRVYKCLVYGDSHSESTDWRLSYQACGMFNQKWNGNRMIDVLNAEERGLPEDYECEGQLSLFDED